ncbi:MAG: PhoU domain-containing protein [Aestuariibacter sp.]
MRLPITIQDNLRFLLVEVTSQLKSLLNYFETESPAVAHKLVNRSGYAYNLMLRIQNGCTLHISQHGFPDTMSLRAVSSIAGDLERLAELCRDCVHQLGYLREQHKLDLLVYVPLLKQVYKSLNLVEVALLSRDTELALKLGKTEHKLEKSYKKLLRKYTEKLKSKKHTDDLVTGLFIARTIEQMGDILLNMSESIISSNIGQPMELQRFESLQHVVKNWINSAEIANLEITSVAETRSGSGIKALNIIDQNNDARFAIYKEGKKHKLKEEYEGVASWHRIYPGIAPEIFTYQKTGDSAAMLIEHLQGITFEQLLFQDDNKMQKAAIRRLQKTLFAIWDETKTAQHTSAQFISQIQKRIAEVFAIHPYFEQQGSAICGYQKHSIEKLLKKARKLEAQLIVPFHVYIHGDFNVDNVIYDPVNKHINFIDLHRSCFNDYLQDVSVFLVSNYRLQVLDKPVRTRISNQCHLMYTLARSYANANNDKDFELRLTLGVARSFITSTRFILDKELSKRMFFRGVYLLTNLVRLSGKQRAQYRLPIEELFGD